MAEGAATDRLRAAVRGRAPGVMLVVVGPEGVRARLVAGVADARRPDAISTSFAMPWFSMTKLVTATAAVRFVEQGRLELDEPAVAHVPAMSVLRPLEWGTRITVRHLLQHTAGLANPIPIRLIHPADTPGPDAEALLERLLGAHRRLRSAPGRRSSYSNLSFLALGALLAEVAGRSYESVIATEILEPLAMHDTSFGYAAAVPPATGHHPRRSPLRLLVPRWAIGPACGRWLTLRPFLLDGAPYGGLVGTPEDAARFLRMHLAGGQLDGTRIISEENARAMRRITVRGQRYDLGLAWFSRTRTPAARPTFVEHLGGGAGFYSTMRIHDENQLGILVMGNSTTYDIDAVASIALTFPDTPTPAAETRS